MPRQYLWLSLLLLTIVVAAPGCSGGQKVFTEKAYPDLGLVIVVNDNWGMTVRGSDNSAFKHRLAGQPEYIFPPITAAKGDPTPADISRIPNWRFIGLKGEFDPEMSAMSADYPQPEGLYFVEPIKGELVEEDVRELPWPGAAGVNATVRLYEETHGLEALATADIWHAYTVTFNHDGNAYEFNLRIPSEANRLDWTDGFWQSIINLELS